MWQLELSYSLERGGERHMLKHLSLGCFVALVAMTSCGDRQEEMQKRQASDPARAPLEKARDADANSMTSESRCLKAMPEIGSSLKLERFEDSTKESVEVWQKYRLYESNGEVLHDPDAAKAAAGERISVCYFVSSEPLQYPGPPDTKRGNDILVSISSRGVWVEAMGDLAGLRYAFPSDLEQSGFEPPVETAPAVVWEGSAEPVLELKRLDGSTARLFVRKADLGVCIGTNETPADCIPSGLLAGSGSVNVKYSPEFAALVGFVSPLAVNLVVDYSDGTEQKVTVVGDPVKLADGYVAVAIPVPPDSSVVGVRAFDIDGSQI